MNESKKTGRIFDIQRFCVHDGPGIRTTVFLKGCPLACLWCHNPEGIYPRPQIMFHAEKCIGCQRCGAACSRGVHIFSQERRLYRPQKCNACGACIKVCDSRALTFAGRAATVDEVFQTVLRDKPFYGTEGGVTFSGGEALMQPRFLQALLKRAREEKLSAAVDTSGYAPWQTIEETLEYTDLYLYDIKAHTPELHKELTGVDNQCIIENLRRLDQAGARIWIRMPLVQGVNDSLEELTGTAQLLRTLPRVERVEMMPYHVLGRTKYEMIGRPHQREFHAPTREQMETYRALFLEYGLNAMI